jgi:uncharacterized protein (TIGR02594 family)
MTWCGLLMALCAKRAGFPFNQKALSAKEWVNWGVHRKGEPMLGDVLVFGRKGGGHVGLYVGEDKDTFFVLGGNQSDQVCITRIAKNRLMATKHCDWRFKEAKNIRRIFLSPEGEISHNEA